MADNVKTFITNLKKPFADMKLRKTALMAEFLSIIDSIGQLQASEKKTLGTALTKLTGKSPVAALPGPGMPAEAALPPPTPVGREPKLPEEPPEPEPSAGEKPKPESPTEKKRNMLLSNLVNISQAGVTKTVAGIKEGLQPVQTEVAGVKDSVVDSMLGPLASIARSSQDMAMNTLKNLGGLAKDRFAQFREWRRERKDAKAQLKAQKRTEDAVEDLEKTTKKQFIIRSIMNMFNPLTNLIGAIGGMFDPKVLGVALAAAFVKKLFDLLNQKESEADRVRRINDRQAQIERDKEMQRVGQFGEKVTNKMIDDYSRAITTGERLPTPAEAAGPALPGPAVDIFATARPATKADIDELNKDIKEGQQEGLSAFGLLKNLVFPKKDDVKKVVKEGFVPLSAGDIAVDKDALANVISGAKGAAIEGMVNTGTPEGRDTEGIKLLSGIKNAIEKNGQQTVLSSKNMVQNLQNVITNNQASRHEGFFDMVSAQEI